MSVAAEQGAQQGGAGRATQVQLRQLFPTPVALFELPDAGPINAALETRIFAREKEVPSVRRSNWGGWQSPDDLPKWCGAEGEKVLAAAQGLASQLTSDREGRRLNPKWRMNAWANVNRHGQGNEFHTHPGAFWSATYYVRDGGVADDPTLGGEFEIQDPRGIAPAMLAPLIAFAMPGGQSAGASELIRPRAGLLVLFPSWLSHGVRPYAGTDVRISIALNLTPA
jgi:uncharacterized protein (TIGR02466 family)